MTSVADAPGPDVSPKVLLGLCAFGQAVVVALIIAIAAAGGATDRVGGYAFAAGFGAILLVSRRFPVAVLVVGVLGVFTYYALGFPPIGMAIPVVCAFYLVAVAGDVRVGVVVGVVLLAVSLGFRIGDGEAGYVLAYDMITNAALIGCAMALAVSVHAQHALRRQHDELVIVERQRQRERDDRLLGQERLALSREVHDSVGHALTVVAVQARVAREAVGRDDAVVAVALDHVAEATRVSLADLRRTLATLRRETTEESAAPDEIDTIVQAARDAGLEVQVSLGVDPATLSDQVRVVVYRIVQESVTNVLRHAQARHALVEITDEAGSVLVRVVDDGRGLASGRAVSGRGIAGMEERAAALGGSVTVDSGAGGVAVAAAIPIRGRED